VLFRSLTGKAAFLLLSLVVIENTNVLLAKFVRSRNNADQQFKIRDMMLVTELCKVLLASLLESRCSGRELVESLSTHRLHSYESLKVSLPALLYFVQNSLFYVALTNLAAPVFQVLYQMKLLTTAVVSVLLLQRAYSASQWASLCTLTLGSTLAIMANYGSSKGEINSNVFIGVIAVIAACFCSAFAGVGFEKLLKQDSISRNGSDFALPSLWMRNIQLGVYSVVFATCLLVLASCFDGQQETTAPQPFLFGFSPLVWILVFLRASCGLLVAVIIKHLDNVVKSIASSVSVLAGCLVSMLLFGDELDWKFWFGTAIVLISSFIFSQPPRQLLQRCFLRKRYFNYGVQILVGFFVALNFWNTRYFLHFLPVGPYPANLRISPFSSVPGNYSQQLHFHIHTVGAHNSQIDCGGCNVLWELYFTLLQQNFSASTTNYHPDNVELQDLDIDVVVVYPEVLGKTLGIGNIHVRWILAPVGIKTSQQVVNSWNPDDLIFNYATSTGVNVSVSNVLQVVNTPAKGDETDISDEMFYSKNRSGIAWMMRKGPKFHTVINPIHNKTGYKSTQVDRIVNKSSIGDFEYFISYDPYTYWTWFAAMQGTVSIVYPLANISRAEWELGTFLGSFMQDQHIKKIPGVAYGWESSEIAYARQTMHELRPFLLRLRKWGAEVTVQRFARDCYRFAKGEREHFEGAMLKKDVYP